MYKIQVLMQISLENICLSMSNDNLYFFLV